MGGILSDEHYTGELQPQHSSATERIHHPGQPWNGGAAGLHVQTGIKYSMHAAAGIHNMHTHSPILEPMAAVMNHAESSPVRINATLHAGLLTTISTEPSCSATDNEQLLYRNHTLLSAPKSAPD